MLFLIVHGDAELLFLGAGASAPFGIPTAPRLTEEIRDLLSEKNQGLLDAMNGFFKTTYEREPNYEEILTLLTDLTKPANVRAYHIADAFARNPEYKEYRGDYSHIIDRMYEIVCNHCTDPFVRDKSQYLKPEELETKFQMTYDSTIGVYLSEGKQDLVFSTNYDPSLEIWCQKRNLRCFDGTQDLQNIEVKKVMDESNHIASSDSIFQHSDFSQQPSANSVGLVRLHGSVWTYEAKAGHRVKFTTPEDRRFFSDLYKDIVKKKPILIFPGEEDRLGRGQWNVLYQYFQQKLEGNCLFIGYSFGTDVINAPILDNLNNGKITRLGILAPDPDKVIENLSKGQTIPEDRVVRMPAHFGFDDALRELIQKWFPFAYRVKFDNEAKLLEHIIEWRNRKAEYIR